MTRTLVTGGAGFLGSHLCDRLLDDGHDLCAVAPNPVQVCGKAGHFLIHFHAANTGAATQRRVKNLKGVHW